MADPRERLGRRCHGSGREQAEPTVWQPLDTRCHHDGRWRQGHPTQTGRQAERRDPGWHAADPARDWAHDSSRRHAAGGRRYRRSRSKICRERVARGRGLWFGPQTRELTPRVLGCGVEQGRPAPWLTMSAFGNCEIGLGDRHKVEATALAKLPRRPAGNDLSERGGTLLVVLGADIDRSGKKFAYVSNVSG